MELSADYFDARSSRRHPVRVSIGDRVAIEGEGFAFQLERSQLTVLPRLGRTPARVMLPGGGLLVARDFDGVEAVLGASGTRQLAHRLESHPGFVLLALVAIVVAAWFAYRDGIPWVAREIAMRMPPELEAKLAEETLHTMDRIVFKASRLDAARTGEIAAGFASLRQTAGLPASVRLEFRDGGLVGPNALALPGGVVVVTDQLAELMEVPQVVAVLAHELGHLAARHGTRHVIASSLHAFLAMAVFGDAAAIAGLAATFPTVMMTTAYSRDFEREADAFAIALLRRSGRSPRDFALALDKLRRFAYAEEDRRRADGTQKSHRPRLGYLETHPDIEERLEAAEDASR
jgi:Zn-dependent protease with chaperone function